MTALFGARPHARTFDPFWPIRTTLRDMIDPDREPIPPDVDPRPHHIHGDVILDPKLPRSTLQEQWMRFR